MKGREAKEKLIEVILFLCALSSGVIVLFLVASMFLEGYPAVVDWFLNGFGMEWKPSALEFGTIPFIFSTLYVGLGAIAIASVIGIPCAIYLAEFADLRIRNIIKPALEMLTGLPSVVIGLFGFILIGTFLARYFGAGIGVLSAWIILAIMSIPHIASISEDAMRAVPNSYREAALGTGATRWQTTLHVVVPAAKSGIIASLSLAMGNAIGETMAVLMVIGGTLTPPVTLDPRVASDVLTALIARDYAEIAWGDPHWQALFGVALILFAMVGLLNTVIARVVMRGKSR